MTFRVSSFHRCVTCVCLGTTILTACGIFPTATPAVLPTCVSPAPEANPYLTHPATKAGDIYASSINSLGSARQDALFQLGQNMEHWSAQVDVANDNNHMVRITVTYLDPALIQYIVLNHLINEPDYLATVVNAPLNVMNFDYALDKIMKELGMRNEMLFIVTITSPFYSRQALNSPDLTVKLSIDQMTLTGASNIQVKPTHFDHILNESMDITQGPISGIVGYPLALLLQEDQCALVIDRWTNTLTLDSSKIMLGNIEYPQRFWNIPYRSLIMESDTHPTPTYDPNSLNNPISKLNEPPTPDWTPMPGFTNSNLEQLYWENMGRYVWNLVITESHH